MPVTNAAVDILLGNVESRILGPVPVERLDRTLNAHLGRNGSDLHPTEWAEQVRLFEPIHASFITGALPLVKRLLRAEGVRYRVRDLRSSGRPIHPWKLQGWTLRAYQKEVVDAAVARGTGLIDVGTGGGKTMLAAAIIARHSRNTLYLVTTRTLLEQSRRELHRYLGFEPGVIGAGERRPGPLTVALAQAVARPEEDLQQWQEGVIVFDEGHHAAAYTYFHLLKRVRARFNYFLSAAPYREGGDQAVLDMLTGGSLTDRSFSASYLIENGYACPVEVRIERTRIRGEMTEKPFWTLYEEFIARNEARNGRIVSIAREHIDGDSSVLILVDRKEHGSRLLRSIGGDAAFVHGQRSRAFLNDKVDRFASGDLKCLVATAGLFQEGVSINGIHVLIQAGALKSRVKVLQSIGRGMRKAPGKDRCLYHDFYDDDELGVFRAHSLQRMRVMRAEGFDVPEEPKRPPRADAFDEIPPMWSHVPGTRRFILNEADGRLRARGLCMSDEVVPDHLCATCKGPKICEKGGGVTWRDARV